MNKPDVESDNSTDGLASQYRQGIIAGQLSVADSSDKIGAPAREGSSRSGRAVFRK
jgi:hypothetical protein